MILLPLIARELRVEARHSFTYWLRVLGVSMMLLVALFFALERGFAAGNGAKLFAWLHATFFGAIWFLVPLVTADCISRERREGTLGLLFLTSLKGRDIVVAKGLAHGLRAMTLCVAVLPVLTIPFLIGGVSWHEALLSCLVNFSSFCCALAAGILASSYNKAWLRSLFTAVTFAFLYAMALTLVLGFSVLIAVAPYLPGFDWSDAWRQGPLVMMVGLFAIAANISQTWAELLGLIVPKAGQIRWLFAAGGVALLSVLVLMATVGLAARNVRRRWQEEPPSARRLWWRQTFCTPVLLLSFFSRWMRRKLDRNPIGWLEQRTWSGRLVTWGWLAVMVSIYSAILGAEPLLRNELYGLQYFLGWLLALSMAGSAAGSFRRERETGVLELLLVAPLSVNQIIGGRLRGLWGQFLPAFLLLGGVSLYLGEGFKFDGDPESGLQLLWSHACTFVTLPVIGLYFSLMRSNFISALLLTLFVGLFLPLGLSRLLLCLGILGNWQSPLQALIRGNDLILPTLFQLALAVLAGSRLHQKLARRRFAYQTAT